MGKGTLVVEYQFSDQGDVQSILYKALEDFIAAAIEDKAHAQDNH